MELFLKNFLKTGSVSDIISFLEKCVNDRSEKKEEIYQTGITLGNYFLSIFPNNSEILTATAFMAYYLNDYELCFELLNKLENFVQVNGEKEKNNEEIKIIKADSISKIKDRYLKGNWTYNFKESELKLITFSITTCKRYDLFEKTMNSFLHSCLDLHLINRWICVDDNSSDSDRNKMKTNFPFFEFIFKNENDKGHCRSMNIIQKEVKTPYLFHMEDDWLFFNKDNYIMRCLEVLSSSDNIGQCLINKNYSETEKDNIVGGIKALTEKGNIFYIHEYCKTEEENTLFKKNHPEANNWFNCNYWPHFSLRPSLLKTIIYEKIGAFVEESDHFEMEYAYRYVKNNYASVFLPGTNCLHIGRLTSERHDKSKPNAYDLNNECQFVKKEIKKHKTFIVNLSKRQDRWKKIVDNLSIQNLDFERFEAIDGSLLKPNEKLQRIFEFNDYNMRQGMVGCALSHIQLCIQLVNSVHEYFLILEDDIESTSDFFNKLNNLVENLPKDWDLCYLSYHLWKNFRTNEFLNQTEPIILQKWNTKESLTHSMGGTGAYLISKNGAKRFLEFINSTSMTNGIDTMQQKFADFGNIYYCKPQLVFSECVDTDKKVDTDIQYNFSSLSIPFSERFDKEIEYFMKQGRKVDVLDVEKTKNAVTNMSYPNIILCLDYNNEFSKCIFPSYRLRNFFVAIPNATSAMIEEKCFERLKRESKFDISDALQFKEKTDSASQTFYISISDSKHISEFINKKHSDNPEFPFDTMSKLTLKSCIEILEKVLSFENEDNLKKFISSFFDLSKNKNALSEKSYKGFLMFYNNEYNVIFPHENYESLVDVYIKRFNTLRKIIKNDKNNIVFIHASRYEVEQKETFEVLVELISKYNKNFKIVSINSFKKSFDKIETFEVSFPLNLRTEEWTSEKIQYDQTTFRKNLESVLEKIVI